MSQIPPLPIARILKQHGLWATKGLGQNFLQDAAALEAIAHAAEIGKDDVVLEVGPGLGGLTRYLAVRAREVVAVELDERLVEVLRGLLKEFANVRLIQGDILEFSAAQLDLPAGYILAANIPYNITSALIRHLLESAPRPRRMVLTVQREVADRICAKPPDMSLLALGVQVYGKPQIVSRIPAEAFFPVPKVDSAVVRIDLYPAPVIAAGMLPAFFEASRAAFAQKRKKLRNSISAGAAISPAEAETLLQAAAIDAKRRPETLTMEEWAALSARWQLMKDGRGK